MKTRRRRQTELLLGVGAFYVALWLLWWTPVVFPLRIFVVLLHEVSHAIAAVATGGSVERIVLHANEGGATYVRGGSPFIMLSAGYLGSLLWGLALIEVAGARAAIARRVLMALAVMVLVVAVLYMRNIFGFMFSVAVGGALLLAARRLRPRGVAVMLLVVGLTSALYALLDIRSDILARPHLRSDARMLAELTGVPTLVWGGLWTLLGLVVCWYAVKRWLRRA
ncbi:hypothetical protein BH23GEM9_BH23GEM9_16170 [soil metagenome]